jgi:hypothetical protein
LATPQDALARLLGRKSQEETQTTPGIAPQDVLKRLTDRRNTSADEPVPSVQGEPLPPLPQPKPTPSVAETLPQDELGLSIQKASTANPSEAARKADLARRLERNPELVTDLAEAEREVFIQENDPQDLQNKHPAVSRYLINQQNAQLVGRNVDSLK